MDILRIFGPAKYAQGKECFTSGRVLEVDTDISNLIMADVADHRSAEVIHNVNIVYYPEEYGMPVPFSGECTCGKESNCRHLAAALLSVCNDVPTAGTAEAHETRLDSVTPELHLWLNNGPAEAGMKQDQRRRTATPDQLFFVFSVLRQNAQPGVDISFYRGRLLKNGTVGRSAKAWYGFERMTTPQKFLTLEDLEILANLTFYRHGRYREINWPDGEELVSLVRRIVDTARARAGDIHGPALSWTGSVSVSVAWAAGPDGAQRPVFRSTEGTDVDLMPFPVPLVLDSVSGRIGVAETDLPPETVAWLASAPPTPVEATNEVSSRLQEIDRKIPLPEIRHTVVHTEQPVPRLTLFGFTPPASAHRAMQVDIELYLQGIWADLHLYTPKSEWIFRPIPYPCGRVDFVYPGAPEPVRAGMVWGIEGRELHETLPDIRMLREDSIEIFRRDHDLEQQYLNQITYLVAKHCPEELMAGIDLCLEDFDRDGQIDWLFPTSADPGEGGFTPALDFLAREVPKLRSSGWQIEIDDSWPYRIHEGPVVFSTAIEPTENDWFSLSLQLQVDDQAMDLVPLIVDFIGTLDDGCLGDPQDGIDTVDHIREMLAGQTFHPRLPDGTVAVIDADRLAPFIAAFLETQGLVGFHPAEAGRATALAEALDGCGAPWTAGRELQELGNQLRTLTQAPMAQPPAGFVGDLRPYQLAGYGWLRALAATGFGGVLADDMGLGKTVQALALLAHRYLEEEQERPSLLVVPTSLLGNWRREAERFVPALKVLILHGPDRWEQFDAIPEHHLVVTTYPLVHRDHRRLFDHEYDLAILDEAQNVKNPAAATSKRIREIRARQRIALTGTPIENSLEELWALYDWLIPGLLGDRKFFSEHYRKPIEKQGDTGRQKLLSTRLQPFLLRRTKEEVASELPPKTVIDDILPLEPDQAALYESIRAAMDQRVRRAIAQKGLSGSRITILDALLKLRQVCCDPALVKLKAAEGITVSAKRTRLLQLLEELLAEGRQVLVFSQFVTMLRLIESDLKARGWLYSMLHGQTRVSERDSEIRRFQDGETPIFLVSLKAGGTGLNLTAADTVILYDPWWNPATERQAMDRAHRIGQNRPVFVHRLIAEGTVETAIQEMQARKQALADALFEGTSEGPMALTEEDLGALFGDGLGIGGAVATDSP